MAASFITHEALPVTREALLAAVRAGHVDQVVHILLVDCMHQPSRVGYCGSAFRAATLGGHAGIVRALLSLTGARSIRKSDCIWAMSEACAQGKLEILQALLLLTGKRALDASMRKNNALRVAAGNGHADVVQFLLQLRHATGRWMVDPHAKDDKALRRAARFGHTAVVEQLLRLRGTRRVNVHARKEAALVLACTNGHVDIVRMLLELPGARAPDVHAQCDAALQGACREGHVAIARMLVSLPGARAAHVDTEDGILFEHACEAGDAAIARILLSVVRGRHCIDTHAFGDYGFRRACATGSVDVVRLLVQHPHVPHRPSPDVCRSVFELLLEHTAPCSNGYLPSRFVDVAVLAWMGTRGKHAPSCRRAVLGTSAVIQTQLRARAGHEAWEGNAGAAGGSRRHMVVWRRGARREWLRGHWCRERLQAYMEVLSPENTPQTGYAGRASGEAQHAAAAAGDAARDADADADADADKAVAPLDTTEPDNGHLVAILAPFPRGGACVTQAAIDYAPLIHVDA